MDVQFLIGKMMSYTEPKHTDSPNQLRRKIFRGAYGGVGVLMAVQAKTALGAGVCASPSAIISGNTSPRPGDGITCSGGRSPGFWKVPQHSPSWLAATAEFPTFSVTVDVCRPGMQDLTVDVILTRGTLLSVAFPGAPTNVGMWEVLAFPNDYTDGMLLRHLSAAWLNSRYPWPGGTYPLSTAQVEDMWLQLSTTGLYCPTSMTCTDSTKWDATEVIAYISGMYDISAETVDGPDLCKKN